MADKKPEWEQDNKPTNRLCPNGHPVVVYSNKAAGQGRYACTNPQCGWNDGQKVLGRSPGSGEPAPHDHQKPISKGVRILSMNEDTEKSPRKAPEVHRDW